ncbi:MAG: hypothetical protein H5T24_10340, partial [Bacteroidales bacterium]|nr:hypothetical protein [Bacteroidales bacterium]
KHGQGNFSKGVLDGEWIFWWPNGNVKQHGSYCKGKACGRWKYFNSMGALIIDGNYIDDKENGIWTTFYPNGAIAGRIWYLRGKPVSVKWLYDGQGLLQKRFSLEGLEK